MASESLNIRRPTIVIVGPTASGKTALAIELAKKHNGEIICADSRTVYKGLDIGTAKPTKRERSTVQHWGIDLVQPGELFTVADFQRYTLSKMSEIYGRKHIPFLVGGTGLYVDSVVYDFRFPPRNEKLLRSLQDKTLEELIKYCEKNNVPLPNNYKNRRHLISAILRKGVDLKRSVKPQDGMIVVGIATDKEVLRTRIIERAEQIFSSNVVEETIKVVERYGWESEALTGNIYPIIKKLLAKDITIEQAKQDFCTADWRLAKRQMTWLRRDKNIKWLEREDAYTYLDRRLALVNKM